MHTHTPPQPASRSQAGFSLIELVVGVGICIVALSAVVSSVVQMAKQHKASQELNLAYIAATNNLEELRSVPYAGLVALHGTGFDVPTIQGNPGGLRALPGDPDGLPGQFLVAVDQTGGGTTLYRVLAEVHWVGSNGNQKLQLETLVGERDHK